MVSLGVAFVVTACAKETPDPETQPKPNRPIREAGATTADADSTASATPDAGLPEAGVPLAPPTLIGLNAVENPDNQWLEDVAVLGLAPHSTSVVVRGTDPSAIEAGLERAALFVDSGIAVLFSIDILRGNRRYEDILATDYPSALRAAVDTVFDSQLPLLGVALGEGLDVQLSYTTGDDRRVLESVVSDFLQYAANHPSRSPQTHVTFHTSPGAWSRVTSELTAWSELSDALCISWFGVDEMGRAIDSIGGGETFEKMLDSIPRPRKPVLVREVAYPSASIVESSFARQDRFFSGLLPVLAAHPLLVPMLAVSALQDPSDEECQSYIEDYGLPSSAALARCSVGLTGTTGKPKPAYYTLVGAFALADLP